VQNSFTAVYTKRKSNFKTAIMLTLL